MSHTKRQIVDEAFEELAIGGAFNVPPEDKLRALRRLESMIAQWESKGIVLGYAFPANTADSDLDDASGVADRHVQALQLNLAIALAPSFGKTVTMETKAGARDAYLDLLREATTPASQEALRAGVPLGAGNKAWRSGYASSAFTPDPAAVLSADGVELEL